jgi:SAM-dependent methyltransferase
MLRYLVGKGIELYGFDLTPQMVTAARACLAPAGIPPERIWTGSVLDAAAFRPPYEHGAAPFAAAICCGVLPHVPADADELVVGNLSRAVKGGGLVVLEARNQLFALFTLNRYSRDFFHEELIRTRDLVARAGADAPSLSAAIAELDERFRIDLPPVRKGFAGEPGYDEVLSRTHNPFLLRAQLELAGLVDVRLLFYHYHCLPPMLERAVPALFRRESLALEDPMDWRGHFMASAFLAVGKRP